MCELGWTQLMHSMYLCDRDFVALVIHWSCSTVDTITTYVVLGMLRWTYTISHLYSCM